jgi:hypothetical protein
VCTSQRRGEEKKSIVMLGASLHFQERDFLSSSAVAIKKDECEGGGRNEKNCWNEKEEDNIMPYAKLRYFSLYNFQLFFSQKNVFTLSCQSAPHREHSSESK